MMNITAITSVLIRQLTTYITLISRSKARITFHMNTFELDKSYLLNMFQRIPPSHIALFLRLIRLYPTNIVDDSMKREKTILDYCQ